MSPSLRNTGIYVLAGVCALIVASRVATVALLMMYAPEDAEPYFYLKQIVISAVCVGLFVWLWGKRIRP
jgi:hypothetical protein